MGNIFKSIRAQSAQGLAIKDDGNVTAIFVEDGGQVGIGGSTAPTVALDITGAIKKTLGTIAAYTYNVNAAKTQNYVFDTFSPYVPNTNDEAILTGVFFRSVDGKCMIVSSIKRTASNTITIYGSATDGAFVNSLCTDGTTANVFSGTASLSL